MFFSVWMERKENHGEDAPPLMSDHALAVCDGMGGAGAIKCVVNGLDRAGAYFASREVSKVFNQFVEENQEKLFASLDANEDLSKYSLLLHDQIQKGLNDFVERNGIDFKIKGTFFKLLPTTLAGVAYRETKDNVDAVVFWVGDSRVYGLDPVVGLLQLSRDDLEGDADAMENLMDDARMDNCISLTEEFKVHMNVVKLNKPTILFAATDGCFGYLPSPLHFEDLFYNAMNNIKSGSKDLEGMSERLLEVFKMTASDDCTVSAKAFGLTPAKIKDTYNFRRQALKDNYLGGLPKDFFDEVTLLNQNQDKLDELTEDMKSSFIKHIELTFDKKEDEFEDLKSYQKFKKNNEIFKEREVARGEYLAVKEKYEATYEALKDSFYEDYIQSLVGTDKATKEISYYSSLQKDLVEQNNKIKQASKFFKERFGKVGSSLLSTFDLIAEGNLIPADNYEETKQKVDDFEKIIGFIKGCLEGGSYEQQVANLKTKIAEQKAMIVKADEKKLQKALETFMYDSTTAQFASKQTQKFRLEVQSQEGDVAIQKNNLAGFDIGKQLELYFDSSKDEVVPYILNKDDESLYSKAQKDLFYQYQHYIEESQQIIVQMQVTVAEKYWNSYRFYYESSMPKKEA